MAAEGIWIFLDNSNLWIEAKKMKGSILNEGFTEDPRLRIDVGKLADVIGNGRKLIDTLVYGSVPPPLDTIWKKFEEEGWEIKIFERSKWTGREKKVDTQIVADVTEVICNSSNRKRGTTVVIVSGDNDMSPCIEKAVKREWNVEVWAMKQNLGADLKRLRREWPGLMSIQYLTQERLREITYTSEKFDFKNPPRNALLNRGIVLQHCISQLQDDGNEEYQDLRKILNNFKWPWRRTWILTESTMSCDLLILFVACQDKSLDEDTPLKRYVPELKRLCQPNLCRNVLSYHEYTNAPVQDTVRDFGTPNRFNALQECKDDNEVATTSATTADMSDFVSGPAQTSEPVDEEPFQQVKSKKVQKAQDVLSERYCPQTKKRKKNPDNRNSILQDIGILGEVVFSVQNAISDEMKISSAHTRY